MIATKPDTLTIPISFERCPVHHSLVARDGEGHLIGKCDGCAGEAADALIFIRRTSRGV